ncbi:MAG: hypothetical protein IPL83_08735 [Bdellovibrionales bacterium]|nr:hypothetical protein [Bdellovibrionales bacterium]
MERMIRLLGLCLAFAISTLAIAQPPHNHEGTGNNRGELKPGRYVGWIALDGRNEKIAVLAEFFLESPTI